MIRIEVQDQFGQWHRYTKVAIAVICLTVTLTGCGRSDREIRMARECYEASRAVAIEYDRGGSQTNAPYDYQTAYAEALNWQDKVCD